MAVTYSWGLDSATDILFFTKKIFGGKYIILQFIKYKFKT